MRKNWIWGVVVGLLVIGVSGRAAQQDKPFSLPMNQPAGPSTWLLGQLYGNTVGAYNFGQQWYSAGQGLHFGIDFSMPCGTPLVAVADGVVAFVDDLGFGAGPHNLLIRHPEQGVITLYGHLLEKPALVQGQAVQRGDVVALSGDPDVVCDSRPHLHFEVRSLDYSVAYNPVDYIDADWHGLAAIGSFGYPLFQQDLDNPRRWVSLDDQPQVVFWGRRLNAYAASHPLPGGIRPPENPPPARQAAALSMDAEWTQRHAFYPGCCVQAWWHPLDGQRFYVIDGPPSGRANVAEWHVLNGPSQLLGQAPPPLLSPDGSHQVILNGEQTIIRRLADSTQWLVNTSGSVPVISTDNRRLMWLVRSGMAVPGEIAPQVAVWVSEISGAGARLALSQAGGSAMWLDDVRLLLNTPQTQNRSVTLSVLNTDDGTSYTLGTWEWLRGLSVSPGGERLMFYTTWQPNPDTNGIYMIDTTPGAQARKLNWFGSWRWRDANSLFYMPFGQHSLYYYNALTGEERRLNTPPVRIANNDWAVSPDGLRILYYNANDYTTYLLEAAS